MKSLLLSRGQSAIVDDCDFDRVSTFKWYAKWDAKGRRYYAARNAWVGPKRTTIKLHHTILDAPQGLVVDHINGDGLDNRRANLRSCSQLQNMANQGPRKSLSGFKGVHFDKRSKKWSAAIGINGRRLHIGTFKNPEDAARAYDASALLHCGEFARLNFPNKSGALTAAFNAYSRRAIA